MKNRFLERLFLQEGLIYPVLKILDRLSFYVFYQSYYKKTFASYGDNVRWGKNFWRLTIPKSVRISCPEKISIASHCQIDEGVFLQCHEKGDGIVLHEGVRINCHSHLLSYDKIELHKKVLIAPFVLLTSGNHGIKNKEAPIMDQPHQAAGPITIGEGCWLGQNCKVMGGVELGKYSLVAAGAVVTKSFPELSKLAGVPAKILGQVGV